MIDGLMPPLDMDKLQRGEQTPVLFGSAMTNFGVQLLLDTLMRLGSPPMARCAYRTKGGLGLTPGKLFTLSKPILYPKHVSTSAQKLRKHPNL